MRGHHLILGGTLAVGLVGGLAQDVRGEPLAALEPVSISPPKVADRESPTPDETPVSRLTTKQGFIFHPSRPGLSEFRFGLGAFYDAIDPQVMYGLSIRAPQLTLDARYGLGDGWSLKGHFNSMFVVTELLLGAGYAADFGKWSLEANASVGVYFGKLGQFGFDAAFIAPEYRPELTVGYDWGDIALSFRGTLLLMGPERVRVGDTWAGLDNSSFFAGHSEMVYVENTTRSDSVWYFGLGAMTTRAYYALWLLFPDSPALFTYPRIVAGYEF